MYEGLLRCRKGKWIGKRKHMPEMRKGQNGAVSVIGF